MSKGLYLWVFADGRKYWRLRYYLLGKEKSISRGVCPRIGLKEARKRRGVELERLDNNLDPAAERRAEWTEFDLDGKKWVIPAERMKMRIEHVVPLSRQAGAILKELEEFIRDKFGGRDYAIMIRRDGTMLFSAILAIGVPLNWPPRG